jgi:hypothetical protein
MAHVDQSAAAWEALSARLDHIERLLASAGMFATEDFARAVADAPAILRLENEAGERLRQSRPKFWGDIEVRRAVIASHRQAKHDDVVKQLQDQFGPDRAPSRSALNRFWLVLDEIKGVR